MNFKCWPRGQAQRTTIRGRWWLPLNLGYAKTILDIYVSRTFQWYKELFNPMGFDPYNCFLKIWKSIGTPIPKVRTHLGVWRFTLPHSPKLLGAWNLTLGLHSWCAPLQALALVASPRLGLQHLWFFKDVRVQFFNNVHGYLNTF